MSYDTLERESLRKIIHIDMDAFFASVEQRDNPQLKNKPVAVGGLPQQRSVIAAASYEARQYGVRSAMASSTALKLCPHLHLVAPRFSAYKAVSQQIHQVFLQYTSLIEPLSLDEAYLDVTSNLKNEVSATRLAQQIRADIFRATGLTASAGVSYNKFLAKVASDQNKPNGQFVITPQQAQGFLEQLPIHKFYGIGKVTTKKMHQLGIFTGSDLKKQSLESLLMHFGKAGGWYYHVCRGTDNRLVSPHRVRKSLGIEETFASDLQSLTDIRQALSVLVRQLKKRLQGKGFLGRTLTLKVKYADFQQKTFSHTVVGQNIVMEDLEAFAIELSGQIPHVSKGIRLLGLSLSNPNAVKEEKGSGQQLRLCLQC